MDSKIAALIQMIADTVPFVLDIATTVREHWEVHLRLTCLDGLEYRQMYHIEELHHAPYEMICQELIDALTHTYRDKWQQDWQQMKNGPTKGIALCHLGEWSMRLSVEWPPPPFVMVFLPGRAEVRLRLMLHKRYGLTRAAVYQGIL